MRYLKVAFMSLVMLLGLIFLGFAGMCGVLLVDTPPPDIIPYLYFLIPELVLGCLFFFLSINFLFLSKRKLKDSAGRTTEKED